MNVFYHKTLTLRTKLLAVAAIIFVLFTAGALSALVNLNNLMNSADAMHSYVQKNVVERGVADQKTIEEYQANFQKAKASHSLSKTVTYTMLLLTLAVLLLLGLYLSRTLTGPLNRLIAAMHRVGEGDLTVGLAIGAGNRDEIAEASGALNVLVDQLRDSMLRVQQAADVVFTGSQELTAATDQLSTSAQEQASSLEESAASMEEMTSTVKHNADNALKADELAAESRDAANEGVVMAQSIKRSMDLISASSNKIADIIGVINDIAFQTNLLALNAAVEAARAGEHGRGFAVVAAEVRNLAQRSATAAKEIKTLIQDSQDKVGDGAHLVSISGSKLEGIVGKAKQVADLVSEISAASQEQAAGIEQVNRAIVQMDAVTQSTAAQVEELSSTSQSLAVQAQHLKALVTRFRLDEAAGDSPEAGDVQAVASAAVMDAERRAAEAANVNGLRPAATEDAGRGKTASGGKGRRVAGSHASHDDWTEF